MRIRKLALLAGIGSLVASGAALAGDDFSTLGDVTAQPMTTIELDAVRGARHVYVNPPTGQVGSRSIVDGNADYSAAHQAEYVTGNYGNSPDVITD